MSGRELLIVLDGSKMERWYQEHAGIKAHIRERVEPIRIILAAYIEQETGLEFRKHVGIDSAYRVLDAYHIRFVEKADDANNSHFEDVLRAVSRMFSL